MNTAFSYKNPGSIKNFYSLRTISIWAGCLGLVQALVWIALTITGILAYNCVITIEDTFNYGSVVRTIFMALYFKGTCPASNMPAYDHFIDVKTVLDAKGIMIWNCVYLAVAVCWVVTSGLIVNYVKKDERRLTAGIILLWVNVTFLVCAMDFSLGVIFGIDYSRFAEAASKYSLSVQPIESQAAQLLAAMTASISLMIIALKGFILWIINAGLMLYLLIQAVLILTDNDGAENLFMLRKESDDILATRPPIQAYEEERKPEVMSTVYANEAYEPDNTPATDMTFSINEDLITRAARMSMDASLQERRFRNLDNFQQYPPRQRPESSIPETVNSPNSPTMVGAFPEPDYTPPMQRAAQNYNRNQRY